MNKHVAKAGAGCLGLIAAVSIGATLFTGGITWVTAPFRGAVDEREQTVASAEYRIGTKNSFYNDCAAVQAKEDSIRNLELESETASDDRQSRIDQSLTALRNSRAELVRGYNADAQNENKDAMRNDSLPESLDIDDFNTECVVD